MADTLGALVDKLSIVNLKMWNAQENLYLIRRMSLEQFKEKYYNDEGIKELYFSLNKAADLNVQRNVLIDSIDELVIEIPGNNEKLNFEIINSIGQIVFKGSLFDKTVVQTKNFASGSYLFKLDKLPDGQTGRKTFEFRKLPSASIIAFA